jgi:hypothetical protein
MIVIDGIERGVFIAALEAGAEEAFIHSQRVPGPGAGGCGDKFCSNMSHATMAFRAGVLEGVADQLLAQDQSHE